MSRDRGRCRMQVMRIARRCLAFFVSLALVSGSVQRASASAASVAAQGTGKAVSISLPAAPLSGAAALSGSQGLLTGAGIGGQLSLESSLPGAGTLVPLIGPHAIPGGTAPRAAAAPGVTTARPTASGVSVRSSFAAPKASFMSSPRGVSSKKDVTRTPVAAQASIAAKAARSATPAAAPLSSEARSLTKGVGLAEVPGLEALERRGVSSEELRGASASIWHGGRARSGSVAASPARGFSRFATVGLGRSRGFAPAEDKTVQALDKALPAAEKGEAETSLFKRLRSGVFGQLWFWILATLVGGIGVGLVLSSGVAGPVAGALTSAVGATAWWGDTFLTVLRYLAGPLVFASITSAIGGHENPKELGGLSWKVLLYFIFTTSVAIGIGMTVSFLIQPGTLFPTEMLSSFAGETAVSTSAVPTLWETLRGIIPTNPIRSFIQVNTLQIVFMAVAGGVLATLMKLVRFKSAPGLTEKLRGASKKFVKAMEFAQKAVMVLVRGLMLTAPVAVFGLMGRLFADLGFTALTGMGAYIGTVLLGLALLVGFYSLIIALGAKRNPLKFLKNSREAALTGFSTASSAATIPVSLQTAEEKLGVKPAIAKLMITMGSAINMEGTALYQVVATLFLAQVFGVPLSLGALMLIIGTLIVSSLGTPGAPGAGMAILATVLTSVGIPLSGVALILGVDRLLDMCRTSVNVLGDLTSAVVMDRVAGEAPEPALPE